MNMKTGRSVKETALFFQMKETQKLLLAKLLFYFRKSSK